MNETELVDIAREAIWLTITIGLPPMMIGLVVGVVIALVQALTQIQEMTLVFVPKIIAIFAVIFIMFPLFITTMQGFMNEIADKIVGIG
jgi:flagellar biosynthetic protein FliQ